MIFVRFENIKIFEPKSLTKLIHNKNAIVVDFILDCFDSSVLNNAIISGVNISIAPSLLKNALIIKPKIIIKK